MVIVYCFDTIWTTGGRELSIIAKANALSRISGNHVWVLVTEKAPDDQTLLSPRVHLVDLGIRYYDIKNHGSFINAIHVLNKRRKHKTSLKSVFKKICPDIVISLEGQEKGILPVIKGPWATICEIHFPSQYRYLLAQSLFQKCLARINDYKTKQYDQIVVLTNEDKDANWRDAENVSVIPNPVRFEASRISSLAQKRIIAVGRLSVEKNFISLIRAFRIVLDHHPDWTLTIYGEGEERQLIENEIERLCLHGRVDLCGVVHNIQDAFCGASILAVSSIFEGFNLAIVEAMSCGLPVVAYDCPYGPRSLIKDGESGFLVSTGDENAMAEKICLLIEDKKERVRLGANALEAAKVFDINFVTTRWMALFEALIQRKNHRRKMKSESPRTKNLKK